MNTRRFSADMLPNDPFFIGFDRLINRMDQGLHKGTNTNYPPYNIVKVDDDNYNVEVAVAGFARDEITIKVEDGNLFVEGRKEQPDGESPSEYIHKGISARQFRRSFTLSDTIVVRGADLVDGILTVKLENVIPEEKKPRIIEIGGDAGDPEFLKG